MLEVLGILSLIFVVLIAIAYYDKWKTQFAKYVPEVDDLIVSTLSDFDYFTHLSIKGKANFVRRVRYIGFEKKFVGKHKLEVTDEMRIRISATISQLTFGHEDFDIPAFDEIFIYPSTFFNPVVRAKLKGYATPTGKLAVSWPDFLHGYEVPDDNYNLGLHELAHALHINKSRSNDNAYFRHHFKYWTEHSLGDFYNLSNSESPFLRKYGATNFHEFFAVVVEHFFESPQEFFKRLPNLYLRTCILLNQDPMNMQGDYVFNIKNFPWSTGYSDQTILKQHRWITRYVQE